MPSLSTSITVDGHPAIVADAKRIADTQAWKKANAIFEPLGAPSRAWLLMLKSDLDALDRNSSHTITWAEYRDGSSPSSRAFRGWYVVKSERLKVGGEGDANGLHLVEFTDARGIAARHSDTFSIIANSRSYAQDDDFLTGTEGFTWDSLGSSLWSACAVLGAWPGLPFAPDGIPNNAKFVGLNAWDALCVFLDRLDCAVARDPFTNTYTIAALGAVQAVPDPVLPKWNGEAEGGPACEVPEKVRVYFHSHYESYGQERDTEIDDNWAFNGGGQIELVVTGAAGAVPGTIKPLWDDLPWLLDEDNVDANAAARATRAAERSAKWVQRMQTGHAHKCFEGVHNITCGGQVRAVLWRHWGDGHSTITEYMSKPDLVFGFAPGVDSSSCFLSSPARENYSPPDIGRHTFPSYPRLPNIVQVVNTGADAGTIVEATGNGFHLGKVRRFVANALPTLEDCLIRFVDDHTNKLGVVKAINGEYYGPGRLSGVSSAEGGLLPVYTVRRGAQFIACEFTLTADMTAGEAAATRGLWWGIREPPEEILIEDRLDLFRRALTGAKGLAILDDENDAWIPFECESKAGNIKFTLTADPSSGTAAADINSYWGTQQDVQDPGSTTTVVIDATFFPFALDGAVGFATLNVVTNQYVATNCQQRTLWISGEIPSDLSPCGLLEATASFTIDSADVEVMDESPFNQAPTGTLTIHNPFGWTADVAAYWHARWHKTKARWELNQIDARCEDPEDCP